MRTLLEEELKQINGGCNLAVGALVVSNLLLTIWSYGIIKANLEMNLYQEVQLAKLPHYEETRNDPKLRELLSRIS